METKTLDVAEAAGVSHGTVFTHFPSRDELIAAAIGKYSKKVVHRIHDLVQNSAEIEEVLRAHLEGLAENEPFYCRLVVESPLLPAYSRAILLGIQSALAYHFRVVFKSAIERGQVKEMPLHLVFNSWLGLVHHYLVNRDLFAPGKSVLEEKGDELIDYFLNMVRKD